MHSQNKKFKFFNAINPDLISQFYYLSPLEVWIYKRISEIRYYEMGRLNALNKNKLIIYFPQLKHFIFNFLLEILNK